MLSIIFSVCFSYVDLGNPNTTYTTQPNPDEPAVTYLVSAGVGTQYDYRIAMQYEEFAFQCRYGTEDFAKQNITSPEFCACSYNQTQPEDLGDYFFVDL